MSEFDDLKLDKWQEPVQPESPTTGWRIAVGILVVGLLVAGGLYYWRRPQAKSAEVRTQTEQTVAPAATTKPLPEPGDHIDLPPLDQTDTIVRDLVTRLSSHPKVAAWLAT